MYLQHRVGLVLISSLTLIAVSATTTSANFVTGFETPTYVTGSLLGQDEWAGGPNVPRVQTAAEIEAELAAAGLDSADPIHSGEQGLLMTYTIGETTGGFLRRPFTGLETETDVVMNVWARPLTPGADGSTIGFNQGNTFVGLMDNSETRTLAFRFGVVREEGTIVGTTIDYASATAGDAVWVPSGLTWEGDTWYNFRFEADYIEKQYDFYVNDTKVNTEPILFYNLSSESAARVFISRGTNQAGMILDDISVVPALDGDFNGDGVVDAADYTVWRDDLGGEFNQDHYNEWKQNFGATAGAEAAASSTAVPEPVTSSMLLTGFLLATAARMGAGQRRDY